jgi:eukaryotic-like serine/threonine-protein kinase
MLAAGDLVTDRVRLVEPLEDGGMGSVWVADHLTLRTKVAVKFVSLERIADDVTAVSRFMSEASMAAQVPNPHVVRVFDHGVTDSGVPFIVMELLQGETLRAHLRAGALSPLRVAMLMRQLCRALGAAHKRGIIHRDIKPDNIFLTEVEDDPDDTGAFADSLFIKVLDFGLAKRTDLSYGLETSTGTMVGTPSYMSPEQALSSDRLDQRADLWAAAVVAYHALTGELPFRGETLGSLCVAIAAGEFVPPSELRQGIPTSVDRFFERALNPTAEERYPSASALARAFLEAVRIEDHVEPIAIAPAEKLGAAAIDLQPAPTLGGSALLPGLRATSRSRRWAWAAALAVVAVSVAAGLSRDAEPTQTPSPAAAAEASEVTEGSGAAATPPAEADPEPESLSEPASAATAVSSAQPSSAQPPAPTAAKGSGPAPSGHPTVEVAPPGLPQPKEVAPTEVDKPTREWAF